jgi:S1-C subfamily serine protease
VSATPLDGNGHLISVALEGECTHYRAVRPDGSTFEAELVAWDEESSIGVLRSDEPTIAPVLGEPDALQPGDPVWVFGTAYAMPGTIGHGVVSSARRYLGDQLESHYIQTDAPTHQGQSGGPVLDAERRLVGLNAYVLVRGGRTSFDGLAFALPIDVALRHAEDLLEYGEYVPALLGIDVGTRQYEAGVDPEAESVEAEGFSERDPVVTHVDRDGPSAGILQEGDLLLAVGGAPVATTQALIVTVRLRRPGETIGLRVERDGEVLDVEVIATSP